MFPGSFCTLWLTLKWTCFALKHCPPAISFTWQWKITHLYNIEMINSYFSTTVEIDEDRSSWDLQLSITILNYRWVLSDRQRCWRRRACASTLSWAAMERRKARQFFVSEVYPYQGMVNPFGFTCHFLKDFIVGQKTKTTHTMICTWHIRVTSCHQFLYVTSTRIFWINLDSIYRVI